MVTRSRAARPTPYLVAAIDDAHNGSAAVAARLVALAAASGAHAVKFSFRSSGGARQLTPATMAAIRRTARGRVDFVAAPHDIASLKAARRVKPDLYQIDPAALPDLTLLRHIAKERRRVLLVAGLCTERSLREALEALGRADVVILHTVSAPNLAPSRISLGLLARYRKRFRRPVGYLGQETGHEWSLVAAALGAEVIEKRLALDASLEGPQHASSLTPQTLAALSGSLRQLGAATAAAGPRVVMPEELDLLAAAAQSLVARRRLKRGARLKMSDFEPRAPIGGLSPRLWKWIEGRTLAYDLDAGDVLTFGMLA